jgi:hypothetical protein
VKIRAQHVVLVAVAVAAGFVGHQLNKHPKVQSAITDAANDVEATRYFRATGFSCGVEAWSVKTMSDSQASSVNLTPALTTIHTLVGLPVTSPGQRTVPPQAWLLNGTRLISYKLEADSDIHLVLKSPITGQTMIAEIPAPACATGSIVITQIQAARAAFTVQVGTPQTYFTTVNLPVRIVGVGFFDFLHGQTGVAPNGVELHPVISFVRLK